MEDILDKMISRDSQLDFNVTYPNSEESNVFQDQLENSVVEVLEALCTDLIVFGSDSIC